MYYSSTGTIGADASVCIPGYPGTFPQPQGSDHRYRYGYPVMHTYPDSDPRAVNTFSAHW